MNAGFVNINHALLFSSVIAVLALSCGCGTIAAHTELPRESQLILVPGEPRFYRGVVYDSKIGGGLSGDNPFIMLIMMDMALSFVADTAMLPFDARSHYINQPPYSWDYATNTPAGLQK